MSRSVWALISLTRPPNGILMFIAVLAGVALSDMKSITLETSILGLITAYSLNGSSMGFNDYFDREVDSVNAPHRPIPSGLVKPSQAILVSSLLGAVGIVSAALTSPACLAVASIAYAASLSYNAYLKKTGFAGNLAVSLVVVAPFIYGAVMSDGYVSPRLVFFAVPVLLSNTGREVIKGITDVEGDALRGVRTIARIFGRRIAANLGALLYVSAVAVSPIPYLLNLVSWTYIAIVLPADAGFIYSAISIVRNPTPENAYKVKQQTLIWMLIALIAFIAGSLL